MRPLNAPRHRPRRHLKQLQRTLLGAQRDMAATWHKKRAEAVARGSGAQAGAGVGVPQLDGVVGGSEEEGCVGGEHCCADVAAVAGEVNGV